MRRRRGCLSGSDTRGAPTATAPTQAHAKRADRAEPTEVLTSCLPPFIARQETTPLVGHCHTIKLAGGGATPFFAARLHTLTRRGLVLPPLPLLPPGTVPPCCCAGRLGEARGGTLAYTLVPLNGGDTVHNSSSHATSKPWVPTICGIRGMLPLSPFSGGTRWQRRQHLARRPGRRRLGPRTFRVREGCGGTWLTYGLPHRM